MKISQNGLDLIKHFESFVPKAYKDQAGVVTIGYGTTRINGVPVKMGQTCSETEAVKWLSEDILKFEIDIDRMTVGLINKQNKFDALVCFVYNVGPEAFRKSTILKKILSGTHVAEKNFTDWNKIRINGVLTPSKGLTRRRKAEYALYERNKLQFHF